MADFWLTKRHLLEALKMTEGMPQSAFVQFSGKTERKNMKEYTVMTINVNGQKKTLKDEFKKLLIKNGEI